MHAQNPTPLPVVLTPDPEPRSPASGWPSWDEVLTIRRRCDPPVLLPRTGPSWDELLGSR